MVKALLGKKIGMTQIFDDEGTVVPVTLLQVGPCSVVQLKPGAAGSRGAVQIGFDERKAKRTPKPLLGHFAKAHVSPKKLLRDVETEGDAKLEPGQTLGVDVFADTSFVDVCGRSKGRGFAGVIKRHGVHGSPESHGGKKPRHGGSIGAGTDPGRVVKGKKMAGHMGAARVTVRNLRVVKVDASRDLMIVRGAVPGPNGAYVLVRKARASHVRA